MDMNSVVDVTCPCCGEPSALSLDSVEDDQEFVQDCPVCCRPWTVRVRVAPGGRLDVAVEPENA